MKGIAIYFFIIYLSLNSLLAADYPTDIKALTTEEKYQAYKYRLHPHSYHYP